MSEVILKVGAEGGSLTICRAEPPAMGGFVVRFGSHFSEGPPEVVPVASWEDALRALDRYPWPRLYPVAVHPDFRQEVLAAISERARSPADAGRLEDWVRLCAESDDPGSRAPNRDP